MSSFGTFGSCGSFIGSNVSRRTDDSRIGVGWSQEEDKQLFEEIGAKMDIGQIANIHKRTVKGIKLRLIHHALKMMESKGLSIETVAGHFNLLRSDIEDFRNKKTQEKKAAEFRDKKPEYHDKYLELLTDIRDTLKILVEKISEPSISSPISPSQTSFVSPQSPSKKIYVKPLSKIPSLQKIHATNLDETSGSSFESNRAIAPHSPTDVKLQPVKLPTKSIDEKDTTLMMPLPKLKVDLP